MIENDKKNLSYEELSSLININNIYEITHDKLLDISLKIDEVTSINLYFHMLGLLINLEEYNDSLKIAYLSNLISFYIFDVITPPYSEKIARFYAEKSLENNPISEYKEWLGYINRGN
ncbi:MAG: hypothetical protein E7D92_06555 [Anaerococcus sp.]|uniref:Uncharacterized protein n=1 Tax=Anaerococcus nagyae TaxID=1755241 RepID=A0A3E2TJN8_9FIRM|nr:MULTISPECIES: hypothetical protein [Anaerococcus]MBP2069352.1 hypothetical protein [Anaerococcus nagyae]MDU2354243.1 hypothetical protein [Anaerococcus sp.]MDU2565998.1 hypothetical protein [Anaerococcus sp.]RGB77231.1 hypothetical protein DXA39_03150 [Anaerococcus nagyae]